MDEFREKMTWEEYLVYPRKLGWKHEYFDGSLFWIFKRPLPARNGQV